MSDPAAALEGAAVAEAATPVKYSPASSDQQQNSAPGDDVVSVELSAPAGWKKKEYIATSGGDGDEGAIKKVEDGGEEMKNEITKMVLEKREEATKTSKQSGKAAGSLPCQ